MSTGFLVVFAVLGLMVAGVLNAIAAYLPWVTLVIGGNDSEGSCPTASAWLSPLPA